MRPCLKRVYKVDMINELIKKQISEYRPDLVITVKGEFVLPKTVEWIKKLGAFTVLWFNDDPQLFDRVSKHIATAYDYVFTSSEYCVEKYKEIGVRNVEYIAFACDPDVHRRIDLTEEDRRRYGADLCFVGARYPERVRVLRLLHDFNLDIWGPNWNRPLVDRRLWKRLRGKSMYGVEMVKVFNASKIVLNVHHNQMKMGGMKANMRVFEATGCGAFHLTDKPEGLEDLFKVGKELVCYEDESELRELVESYLNSPEERTAIAMSGQKRAYEHHTYTDRAKTILRRSFGSDIA